MTVYVVVDPLIAKDDSWETHLASLLQGYIEAKGDEDCKVVEIVDIADIKALFESKSISNEDKFIFTNAWSSATRYVKHWAETNQVDVELVGFWTNGCYIDYDKEYKPTTEITWRKLYEKGSFDCLNKNFFISKFYADKFKSLQKVNEDKLHIMPFPLDYLDLEMSLFNGLFNKQNLIVFPWSQYTQLQEAIVYDFIRVHKDIQIVFAQEHVPLERHQLLRQLSRAKLSLLPYTNPNIGVEIYECILLGTIPLVPDINGLRELVPEEFRYPADWTSSIFNYSKFAPDMTSKVKELVKNYDSYRPLIKQTQEYLYENYFDSEKLIEQIFVSTKRN